MITEHLCDELSSRNLEYESFHEIKKLNGEWYVLGRDNGGRGNTLRDISFCPFCGKKLGKGRPIPKKMSPIDDVEVRRR